MKKKEQVVIVFRHSHFENKEICAVERWVKTKKEGPQESLFEVEQQNRIVEK